MSLVPLAYLVSRAVEGWLTSDSVKYLTSDPIKYITHFTGDWILRFSSEDAHQSGEAEEAPLFCLLL